MRRRIHHRLLRALSAIAAIMLIFASVEFYLRQTTINSIVQANALLAENDPNVASEHSAIHWLDGSPYVANYSGKYFTVKNGERLTLGQPANADHDLYLFGSSIAFDWMVDDAHTMASYLQKLSHEYRIHNLGVNGMNVTAMLGRLRTVHLYPGDVVLFYDGTIDVQDLVDPIWQRHDFLPCDFLHDNINDLRIGQVLCDKFAEDASVDMRTPSAYEAASADMLAHYARAIDEASAYAVKAGATFYNVIQPIIFTVPGTVRDQQFVALDKFHSGIAALYDAMYPRMIASRPAVTIDLSRVLDDVRNRGVETYQDRYHYNATGNAIVARAIRDTIWKMF